jgi:hypothetical protein
MFDVVENKQKSFFGYGVQKINKNHFSAMCPTNKQQSFLAMSERFLDIWDIDFVCCILPQNINIGLQSMGYDIKVSFGSYISA